MSMKSPVPVQRPSYNFDMGLLENWTRAQSAYWSLVDSVYHPFDRKVIAAIREITPGFVPLVRYMEYVSDTGGRRIYEHHAYGFICDDPRKERFGRRIHFASRPDSVNAKVIPDSARIVVEGVVGGPDEWYENGLPRNLLKEIGWDFYYKALAVARYLRDVPAPEREAATDEFVEEEAKVEGHRKMYDVISYNVDHNAKDFERAAQKMTNKEYDEMGVKGPQPYEAKPIVGA